MTLQIIRRQTLAEWYLPNSEDPSSAATDVIKKAYEQALLFHQANFPHQNYETWLSKASSTQDVLNILAESQQRYQASKLKRWKAVSKAATWWKALSLRMTQYEKVIDSLVSSNPEYAGLVWGAMRFLFTVTLNHQEISAKIAQAFAEIGAVLPEIEFISKNLYPTQLIRATLANIYTHILEFCIRATKWCDKARKSPTKQVFSSVFKTWPLEFQDIRQEIDTQVARLREQAAIAHQAETREIHAQVRGLRSLLDQGRDHSVQQTIGKNQQTFLSAQDKTADMKTNYQLDPATAPIRISPSITQSLPFIIDRVARYLASNTFDPKSAFELATTMKTRRRARGISSSPMIWTTQELQNWISTPSSALLRLHGSTLRAEQSRDVASDLIELLQQVSPNLPIVFYLSSMSSFGRAPTSIIDILRSLIQQAIDHHSPTNNCQPWRLNDADFESCRSEKDWLQLLVAVLSHFDKIVIVIDTHQEASGRLLEIIKSFLEDVEAQNAPTKIKMLVLTYGTSSAVAALGGYPVLPAMHCGPGSSCRSSLGPATRAGPSRRQQLRGQSSRAGASTRRATGSPEQGSEVLKPFVLQFVGQSEQQESQRRVEGLI